MTGNKPGLLPCPFCGGEAVRVKALDRIVPRMGRDGRYIGCAEFRGTRYIGCAECRVIASFEHVTESELIEAWNRRDGGE